jgi:HSP20 family protein
MALAPFFGRRNSLWDVPDPMEVMVTLFDNTPASSYARDAHAVASTSVDWKETPKEHVFKADLPGLRKEDVKVQVEDGRMLSISGQRQKEEVQKTDTWHRVERSSGQFMRKFRLPESADLDHISAKVDSGVLTVVVPKVEKKKETRTIDITGHDESQPAAVTHAEHKAAEGIPAHEAQK